MAGIYLHVPFCKQRCTYCDFHFSTRFEGYRAELIEAIKREIQLRKDELSEEIQTIYFGGGTPSLLMEKELSEILETIFSNYSVHANTEITLEANPEDIHLETLQFWKKNGINRLSIGVQSFRETDIAWMNRGHHPNESLAAVRLAQELGFENITVDLIYGLPELSLAEWKSHLEQVVDLNIQHISAYCLTVEPKTALNHQVKIGKIKTPDEEQQSQQFEYMLSFLESKGFEQYEISNFARNQNYSQHNSSYWKGVKYIGIGPSAHSFNGKARRWNIANNTVYYKNVGKNDEWFDTEILSPNDRWNELFLTGLRTKWGVSKIQLLALGGFTSNEENALEQFKHDLLVTETEKAILLTPKGKLQADGIAQAFFRVD